MLCWSHTVPTTITDIFWLVCILLWRLTFYAHNSLEGFAVPTCLWWKIMFLWFLHHGGNVFIPRIQERTDSIVRQPVMFMTCKHKHPALFGMWISLHRLAVVRQFVMIYVALTNHCNVSCIWSWIYCVHFLCDVWTYMYTVVTAQNVIHLNIMICIYFLGKWYRKRI